MIVPGAGLRGGYGLLAGAWVLKMRGQSPVHWTVGVSPLGERRSGERRPERTEFEKPAGFRGAEFEHRRCEVGLTGRGARPPPLSPVPILGALDLVEGPFPSPPPLPRFALLLCTSGAHAPALRPVALRTFSAQTPAVRYAPGSRSPPQGGGGSAWRYPMGIRVRDGRWPEGHPKNPPQRVPAALHS